MGPTGWHVVFLFSACRPEEEDRVSHWPWLHGAGQGQPQHVQLCGIISICITPGICVIFLLQYNFIFASDIMNVGDRSWETWNCDILLCITEHENCINCLTDATPPPSPMKLCLPIWKQLFSSGSQWKTFELIKLHHSWVGSLESHQILIKCFELACSLCIKVHREWISVYLH